jgi:hypothetical protein
MECIFPRKLDGDELIWRYFEVRFKKIRRCNSLMLVMVYSRNFETSKWSGKIVSFRQTASFNTNWRPGRGNNASMEMKLIALIRPPLAAHSCCCRSAMCLSFTSIPVLRSTSKYKIKFTCEGVEDSEYERSCKVFTRFAPPPLTHALLSSPPAHYTVVTLLY